MYKRILCWLFLLVFIFSLSGCAAKSGVSKPKIREMPSDTEVLKEVTKGKVKSTVTAEDEDQIELKHLKYAKPAIEKKTPVKSEAVNNKEIESKPETPAKTVPPMAVATVDTKPDYRIDFLNEEEVKLINDRLVELGYLKQPASSQKEFISAIIRYQQAEKISCSGQINPETFPRLLGR